MRQVYPGGSALADAAVAGLYAYPDPGAPPRCWVRANMVASLDGAAAVEGRARGLSSEADEQVFAMLRALADVILVGAGTARAEHYGPVRPESEGLRWTWLRDGRTPSAPIAVVTRALDLDLASPLLAGPGADRIVTGGLPMPGGGTLPFTLAHAVEDEGHLLCRYVRRSAGWPQAGAPGGPL